VRPTVHALWIGERLSTLERCSLASFVAHGHPVHLHTYGEVAGVPRGVVVEDAARLVARDQIFKYVDHDSYAGFANRFRYQLLHERGGIWVDADVVCLRPFELGDGHVFASEPVPARPWRRLITNCVIQAPAGSPIMKEALDACLARDPRTLRWGETGPRLLDRVVRARGALRDVRPPSTFCPVPHYRWRDLLRTSLKARVRLALRMRRATYAVHLWNEMWRRRGLDKDARYDPGCLYERLRARYLGDG
jgi:hypothetical protein